MNRYTVFSSDIYHSDVTQDYIGSFNLKDDLSKLIRLVSWIVLGDVTEIEGRYMGCQKIVIIDNKSQKVVYSEAYTSLGLADEGLSIPTLEQNLSKALAGISDNV